MGDLDLVIYAVCAMVVIIALITIFVPDAWGASAPSVASTARSAVGERTLAVVFERWDTTDTFTDGDLRERSCGRYAARKWRCRYVITGYQRSVLSYVERGVVKVRCWGGCVAFRRSVTNVTEPTFDRDLGRQ